MTDEKDFAEGAAPMSATDFAEGYKEVMNGLLTGFAAKFQHARFHTPFEWRLIFEHYTQQEAFAAHAAEETENDGA